MAEHKQVVRRLLDAAGTTYAAEAESPDQRQAHATVSTAGAVHARQ